MLPAVVGIDVGGTNLRFALVTSDGTILERVSLPTEICRGRAAFLVTITDSVNRLRELARSKGVAVRAVGVGVPGLVLPSGLLNESVNLRPLDGCNLSLVLTEATGLPTTVLNDANAAAWGEFVYGAGRPFDSFLAVTLGTGVGGGLVLDRDIWQGADGAAGEFGHVTVEPDGLVCSCGNRGCLEQYASATALARNAAVHGWNSVEELAGMARRGDGEAVALFASAGRYIGSAAAMVVNLLNIEAIILGGGVARCFDLLEAHVRHEINRRAFPLPASRVAVLCGGLGDNAGILGAAARAWGPVRYV